MITVEVHFCCRTSSLSSSLACHLRCSSWRLGEWLGGWHALGVLALLRLPLANGRSLSPARRKSLQRGAVAALAFVHPRLKGVGVAAHVVTILVYLYYNCLVAYSATYLGHSFRSPLPFAGNSSDAAQAFFREDVVALSSGVGDVANFAWLPALLHTAAFVGIYAMGARGASVSGRALVFMVGAPIGALVGLALRAVTLEGARDGLAYAFALDFASLGALKVWAAAFSQVAFSSGAGFGVLFAFGSMTSAKRPALPDAVS